MRLLSLIVAAACFLAAPLSAADVQRVESIGLAYLSGPGDDRLARRRALADALAGAALQGGASLRGLTVMDKARITKDITVLRAAGQVLSYRIVSERRVGDRWEIGVVADVGLPSGSACGERRRLTITARPPRVDVAPEAPAWSAGAAQSLAQGLIDAIRDNPYATLTQIANGRQPSVAAVYDYQSLTRGTRSAGPSDHIFYSEIEVIPAARVPGVEALLRLGLSGPEGRAIIKTVRVTLPAVQNGLVGQVTGFSRKHATRRIKELDRELDALIDAQSCMAPAARLSLARGGLQIPIGRNHGVAADSLGIPDMALAGLPLLEVVELGPRHAILRPLDRSIRPEEFAGRNVYLLRSGLPGGA